MIAYIADPNWQILIHYPDSAEKGSPTLPINTFNTQA